MIQVLIIEDEARAANQLQSLLSNCGFEYQLLDIIDTVEESINWFKANSEPDLLFMDIQLADGLSFEIFQNISLQCPIIFTTAFDQYAIRAFKVNSVDYLLKPIQMPDLIHALDKFKSASTQTAIDIQLVQQMLMEMQAPKKREGILVKDGDGFTQIRITDLLYAYSEESITFGITVSKRVIIEETLDELQNTLAHSEFFRINRGQLISKKAIQKIDKYFNHRLKLTLLHPRENEFIVSRPKTSEFKKWMNS